MKENERRQTNRDRVLKYLQLRGSAMNHELIQVGGMRAMGRVHELRQQYDIDVTHVKGGEWEIRYHGPKSIQQASLFQERSA